MAPWIRTPAAAFEAVIVTAPHPVLDKTVSRASPLNRPTVAPLIALPARPMLVSSKRESVLPPCSSWIITVCGPPKAMDLRALFTFEVYHLGGLLAACDGGGSAAPSAPSAAPSAASSTASVATTSPCPTPAI